MTYTSWITYVSRDKSAARNIALIDIFSDMIEDVKESDDVI